MMQKKKQRTRSETSTHPLIQMQRCAQAALNTASELSYLAETYDRTLVNEASVLRQTATLLLHSSENFKRKHTASYDAIMLKLWLET